MTHALAGLVFLVAGIALVLSSVSTGSAAFTLSVAVFVLALLGTYITSALYHASTDPQRKSKLRTLDHGAIYLLIAGTYSPFAVDLGGSWGIFLLMTIWSLALMGIVRKLAVPIRRSWVSTSIYVAMGWLVVIAAKPFLSHFPVDTIGWLVAGGLAYTLGTPFYAISHRKYMHALWHGFVVLGSTFHLIAVASIAKAAGATPVL